ncbi:hypothetical protein FGO68_gene597 [Halteria grandinella]|uniref:Endoplasmic reticulum vesicle transporter C-terminal domain-containing protein n=1 Tax=Halteria grandinella TaxID=5974 RepID=A0A8J8NKF1_HALGN|nr:hypothetical protein FGO68_gene597 [Halteria grandinella]
MKRYVLNGFQENMGEYDGGQDVSNTGCLLEGYIEVYKAPGSIKIFTTEPVDFSHRIKALQYGHESEEIISLKRMFPKDNGWSPLVGTIAQQPFYFGDMQLGFYSAYYTDVTPITMVDLDGNKRHTLQYSATHQNLLIAGQGGSFIIRHELSPISLVYTQNAQGFMEFIVKMCAVVGGFFTVIGIGEGVAAWVAGGNDVISMQK